MLLYVLTGVLLVVFIVSFRDDKRKISNAFLFLASVGFLFLSVVQFAYDNHFNDIHQLLLLCLFVLFPLFLVIFAVYMIINGFVILKKESKTLANSLSLFFGAGILAYFFITVFYVQYTNFLHQQNRPVGSFLIYGYTLITFFFLIFMVIFFSFLAYSILYLTLPKKKDYDFIIIHGSGLINGETVSPLLASRINKAIDAYKVAAKEDVKFIASGGRGSDEKISEAKAICDYLIEKGISEEKILLEEASTTTYENLQYSKEIAGREKENPKYLFVSNNYHVFRATLYAKRLHMMGEGVGAKTAGYYIPSAFLREYIAIIYKIRWILLLFFLLFLLFLYMTR